MPPKVLIIGSGPAALMAADRLSEQGFSPILFERRRGPGWKLLVAGSSGLNVTYDAPLDKFIAQYRNGSAELANIIRAFTPEQWLEKIHSLGLETFCGTSHRYFLKTMKSSPLLRAWLSHLKKRNATIHYNEELKDFQLKTNGEIEVFFQSGRKENANALLLALGGASWEETLPTWIDILKKKEIGFTNFQSSNAGYHLKAPPDFFHAAEGTPIKGLTLKTARGVKQGELMITRYGLEGSPIYSVGCTGQATLDLKPDLTEEKFCERLKQSKGNMMKRLEQAGKLSKGALFLIQFLAPKETLVEADSTAKLIKSFPITLLEARSLSESISSSGGVQWSELTQNLELKKSPGVFCAGEMIDWDAPTGGFLIQACVSTGYAAAEGIIRKSRA